MGVLELLQVHGRFAMEVWNFLNMRNNFSKELKDAVSKCDLESVKSLLSAGANVHSLYREGTLLHCATSAEIVKELLERGAIVDARDMRRETPLVWAIKAGKTPELVKELLMHGANVNATDRHWDTPLNLVVKQTSPNPEVIKVLLEHGADINMQNRINQGFEHYASALDNAIAKSAEYAKLLIKITVLRNFDSDYQKIINLTSYKTFAIYNELSQYLYDCVNEITQMKADKVNDTFSLYEFLVSKNTNEVFCKSHVDVKNLVDQLLIILNSTSYPIYYDMITEKAKFPLMSGSGRSCLLKKLSELQVYTNLDVSDQDDRKEVMLDSDSVYEVAKYLGFDSLLNFVLAFFERSHQPLRFADSPVQLKRLDQFPVSCAKRTRFE